MSDTPNTQGVGPCVPLLSICIPAYNRPEHLLALLQSIDRQEFPLSYEVRVRDDSHPHPAEAIFREVAKGRANWHYHHNQVNLGGRANIRRCCEGAVGAYVYSPSDDDVLTPDSFELFDRLIRTALAVNGAVIFAYDALGRELNGVSLKHGFEWLRYVSINVPAMISTLIWERAYWDSYDYFGYSQEMSLPQLDCFIEACISRKVVVSNRAVFIRGNAEATNVRGFWFYARNPLLDAFEYPKLYKKVLASRQVDAWTRLWVHARRLAMLRWTVRKALFISHNRQYYHPRMTEFSDAHSNTWYWPFLWVILKVVLETRFGRWLSAFYSDRVLHADRLPSQRHMTHEF